MMGKRERIKSTTILFVGLMIYSIYLVFPVYWLMASSVKPTEDLFLVPATLFPARISFENFKDVILHSKIPRYFLNSIITSISVTAITIVISTLGAYSLTKYRFPGRKLISDLILVAYIFPGILILLPLYQLIVKLQLNNSLLGLILANLTFTVPFCLWMLREQLNGYGAAPMSELSHTLVAIGSHDPLLDEIGDMLHRTNPEFFMSSSHVGSMGGIMAVRRGETHIAGIHLLDETDGSYNTSFIHRYFPNGGVRLVECVGRHQGLMLSAGNPKNIRCVRDLTQPGVRYVNRQKGSGTRILMDYLCKKECVDPSAVYGYSREEFTHTSVAAQIASGTADAGMGIYSAAKLYHLDYLPICVEQYDLLIPDEAWDTPMVQQLIRVLQSDELRARLSSLGGYELDRPGRVRQRF